MATSSSHCGVCDHRHISKLSAVWCTDCDEGLCEGCEEHHSLSKGSRNHTVIAISEYHRIPSDVVKISPFCDTHNEKYSIYCKHHEIPCCRNCIIESHNKCQEIAKLEDVTLNVKSSNAFYEIEQTLEEVAKNIEKIRLDWQMNLKTLPESRKQIEKEIQETRIAINSHIDKIQEDMITELYASEEKESQKIRKLIDSLEDKQQEIEMLQGNISNIKQHASDLQTFLSIKRIETEVSSKNEYLNSISSNESLKQMVLSFSINPSVQNLISDLPNFGKIMVESKPSGIEITTNKQKHAQMMMTKVLSISFEHINLKLQKTVYTKTNHMFEGTCLLPDGRMVFSCSNEDSFCYVTVLNADGSLNFEVQLPPNSFDVAYIKEDDTLAVSSGCSGSKCIYIIDMQNQQVKKTISVKDYVYGISYNGSTLVYCGLDKGIQMINPTSETISVIKKYETSTNCYVATFADKIYHSNKQNNYVRCYDQQGKQQWSFVNKNVLQTPRGIAVDNSGNVYVVGYRSTNLIVISPDGKQYRQLLSKSEGLLEPQSIHFNTERNMLIVTNRRIQAFLYSVN